MNTVYTKTDKHALNLYGSLTANKIMPYMILDGTVKFFA